MVGWTTQWSSPACDRLHHFGPPDLAPGRFSAPTVTARLRVVLIRHEAAHAVLVAMVPAENRVRMLPLAMARDVVTLHPPQVRHSGVPGLGVPGPGLLGTSMGVVVTPGVVVSAQVVTAQVVTAQQVATRGRVVPRPLQRSARPRSRRDVMQAKWVLRFRTHGLRMSSGVLSSGTTKVLCAILHAKQRQEAAVLGSRVILMNLHRFASADWVTQRVLSRRGCKRWSVRQMRGHRRATWSDLRLLPRP